MEIVKNEDTALLYAVTTDKSASGVMGLLIDAAGDGSATIRINAMDEDQVKVVFGVVPASEAQDTDDIVAYSDVVAALNNIYPEGYTVEWVGNWRRDPRTVKLCAWLDSEKIEDDGLFDYMIPQRVVDQNIEMAIKHEYRPSPEFWKNDKSKDFYLGMAGAARIMTSLIGSSKNQKEVLERLNKLSLDSMILSKGKSNLKLF